MSYDEIKLLMVYYLTSFLLLLFIIWISCIVPIKEKNKSSKKGWIYVFILFLIGFIVYFYGIWIDVPNKEPLPRFLYTFLLSTLSTIKMFALSINNNLVRNALTSATYNVIFSITHIIAFTVTEMIIVSIFGHSLVNWMRFKLYKKNNRCIIMGTPDRVLNLLNNFTSNDKLNIKKIVVCDNSWSEQDKKKLYHYSVAISECNRIDMKLLNSIGILNPRSKTELKVTLISLFKDDKKTLDIATLIRNYINNIYKTDKKDLLKFKSYFNFENIDITDVIDNEQLTCYDGRISFFNKADLNAKTFIEKYTVLDLLNNRYTLDKEKALVSGVDISYFFIGFGETNKQLLRKTFVNNALVDVKYKAHIIDKNAREIESEFDNEAPGIRHSSIGKEYADIAFSSNIDVKSEAFKKYLRDKLSLSNCIFVALDDDLSSIRCAYEIEKLIKNINLDNKTIYQAKIFIHVREKSEYVNMIAHNTSKEEVEIEFIGSEKSIFTYDNIIREEFDILGKRVDRAYRILKNKEKINSINDEKDNLEWENNCSQFMKESSRMDALNIRTKLQLIGLELIKKNDFKKLAHYREIDQKKLFDENYQLVNITTTGNKSNETERYLDLSTLTKDYIKLVSIYTNYNLALTNLARHEHKRWNCFHLINGWRPLSYIQEDYVIDEKAFTIVAKKPLLKRHMYIVSWEELLTIKDYIKQMLIDKFDIKDEDTKLLAEYGADVLKYDYFTMCGLSAILKDSDYVICIKK